MGYDCSKEIIIVLAIAARSKEYLESYEREAIEVVKSLYGNETEETEDADV